MYSALQATCPPFEGQPQVAVPALPGPAMPGPCATLCPAARDYQVLSQATCSGPCRLPSRASPNPRPWSVIAGHGGHPGQRSPRLLHHPQAGARRPSAHLLHLLQPAQVAQLQQEKRPPGEAALRHQHEHGLRAVLAPDPSGTTCPQGLACQGPGLQEGSVPGDRQVTCSPNHSIAMRLPCGLKNFGRTRRRYPTFSR